MHEKLDEFNNLKSEIAIEFKNAFNYLLETIKKYKFREDSSKGFAIKQNRNSILILSDLQMLNGIINDTLQYIDTFLIKINSDEFLNKNTQYILKQYINRINSISSLLNDAMYEYYDDSKSINKPNSAVRARMWKKERNNALSYILHVSIGLIDIRNSIRLLYQDYNDKFITEYQEFLDYLTKRPNYYSYFTVDEQRNYTEVNKKTKKKLKLNDGMESK